MGDILRAPNGNALLLTPRSASHSIAMAAVQSFWPDISLEGFSHPAAAFPSQEDYDGSQQSIAVVLRNPVERFRSMVAHSGLSTESQLGRPRYRPLPSAQWSRAFLFETQLQDCADWLGITVPLPQIDMNVEADKPTLTIEQEARVRVIYAADIALWESLQT